MTTLAIKDIKVDPTIQIRRSNHENAIQRYMDAFERLPPVDVFQTPEGKLLADGFHRVAAAQRLGHPTIEAKIHEGTREDAAEFAVTANAISSEPLTPEERNDGIRRLKQLHPDWSLRRIADAISVSYKTVQRVFDIDEVRRSVFTPAVTRVTDSHVREVAAAPKEQWAPLIEAAAERNWSRDATAQAVRNLKDNRIPEERKKDLLAGKADPVVVTSEGQFAIPADIVKRELRERAANDAVLALERALEHLAKLRLFRPDVIVSTVGRPRLERLMEEMPGYIQFMEEVMNAARKHDRKMELVK